MKYKLLGRSGLRVSEACLGTMTFGEVWNSETNSWGASKEESKKIFDLYANAGGNFIDTANVYTNGVSEEYLSDFIAGKRDHFVLATKFTSYDNPDDPNFMGNHRKNMMRSVEGSLKRLKVDFIDVLYLHAWDFTTPIEEVMRGFDDLVSAGKVNYIGISDTPAWIISRANTLADLRGYTRFVANTMVYNLIERTPEHELIPMSIEMGMSVTVWSPLAEGILTGKYLNANGSLKRLNPEGQYFSAAKTRIVEGLVRIAQREGLTPSQLALAWLAHKGDHIIPIVGSRTAEHFSQNIGYLNVSLTPGVMQELDELSAIEPIFPLSFIKGPNARARQPIFGNLYEQLSPLSR